MQLKQFITITITTATATTATATATATTTSTATATATATTTTTTTTNNNNNNKQIVHFISRNGLLYGPKFAHQLKTMALLFKVTPSHTDPKLVWIIGNTSCNYKRTRFATVIES